MGTNLKPWFNIEIPKLQTKGDLVTFGIKFPTSKINNVYGYKTTKKNGFDYYNNVACYSNIMGCLDESEIICEPTNNVKTLSEDTFAAWINLCKQNHLVLPEVEIKENNSIYFPCKKRNKHHVYATLCCYRWSDFQPYIPYTVLKLMEVGDRNFYQCLHYALLNYSVNYGHSFINVSNEASGYDTGSKWLGWGLGASLFFTPDKDGNRQCDKHYSKTEATFNAILAMLRRYKITQDILKVNKKIDVLRKEWTPYFGRSSCNITRLIDRWKRFIAEQKEKKEAKKEKEAEKILEKAND